MSEDEDGAGEYGQVLPRGVDLNVPYTNTDAERVNNVTGNAGETFAMPVSEPSSANPGDVAGESPANPRVFLRNGAAFRPGRLHVEAESAP